MSEILVCKEGDLDDGAVMLVAAGTRGDRRDPPQGAILRLPQPLPAPGRACLRGRAIAAGHGPIGEGGIFSGQTFDEDDLHIVCPWHGYEFHLSNGCHVVDRKLRLKKYEVIQRDGDIYVAV